jgi:hypothetical protein
MMANLVVVQPESWGKCSACGEQKRPFEKRIKVMQGKRSLGTYCEGCEKYARMNHDIDDETEAEESRAERMMEHFAECRVMGMSQEQAWNDWNS